MSFPWYVVILSASDYRLVTSATVEVRELRGNLVVFEDDSTFNLDTNEIHDNSTGALEGITLVPPTSVFYTNPLDLVREVPERTVVIGILPGGTHLMRRLYEPDADAAAMVNGINREIARGTQVPFGVALDSIRTAIADGRSGVPRAYAAVVVDAFAESVASGDLTGIGTLTVWELARALSAVASKWQRGDYLQSLRDGLVPTDMPSNQAVETISKIAELAGAGHFPEGFTPRDLGNAVAALADESWLAGLREWLS